MDIREGEKVSGVIESLTEEGYMVALCNDITGFAPRENLRNGVEDSSLEEGSEVKVQVKEKTEDGSLQLTITELFARDKFQKKPDKYLKNLSYEKRNGGEKSPKPKLAEDFKEWIEEVDDTFKKVKQHRKERLNKDFWTV